MDLNANSKFKRKKKTHGPGNPSKRHRDRLNAELDNLARLLPFPEEIVTKLDKISILRLTVSYLRAKSFFQVSNGRNEKEETCEELVREVEGNGVFSQLSLEALDGFIAVITQDGQLFYVSENVRDFLGYSQAAVIHQSMFKFLHIDDQDMVKSNLAWPKTSGKKMKVTGNKDAETALKDTTATGSEDNESLNRSFTCRMKCTLNHGGGFYKLFRLSGRLREIHTRKRDSQVVEYGLFAICSPASSPHHSGSGVKKEVALTAQRRLERANSDPLPNRRTGLSMPGMMQKLTMNHNFPIPEGRSSVISPLASPTTSTDSGHPSPDSSQGGKVTATDGDNRSREASPSSSSNSQEADGRLISDRFLAGIKNPFMNARRVDHKRPTSFFDSLRSSDKDAARKRSRSMADASEFFLRECGDQRSLFYQSNLPPIPEVKAEDARKVDCSYSGDMPTKRALNSHDNRLDAAQGLVNLGNIASQFPGLCPFPPELMYPDVMFPRADMLQDLQHLRGPFDMHNPCYLGGDPYTALAMRRWLSSPDLFRSPLNPLLAAQAGLLTPADRLRLLQFPLGFHYPFPGPSPFDLGAIPGLGDRSHPDFAVHGSYRNSLAPDIIGGDTPKETGHRRSLPSEKQSHLADGPDSPLERKSGPKIEVTVKKEKVDDENGEETDSAKEEPVANGKQTSNAGNLSGSEEYEDVKVDVVGGVKPASVLRQTFAGIQEEFTSRLENLNKSFAQSLDCNIACPK